MFSNSLRFPLALATTLLLIAASPALAQSRSSRTTGSSNPHTDSEGGRVILFGTPGNCPPTIACGPEQQRRPVFTAKPVTCDHWEWVRTTTGKRIRRCLER